MANEIYIIPTIGEPFRQQQSKKSKHMPLFIFQGSLTSRSQV